MKKVRFETPDKSLRLTMDSHSECHSPRPCIEKQDIGRSDVCYEYTRLLPYNPDPVQRYECSNSSPYPMIAKTSVEGLCSSEPRSPSNDLDLSMLDSSYCEPRQPIHSRPQQFLSDPKKRMFDHVDRNMTLTDKNPYPTHTVLSSIENTKILRNVGNSGKENNFFIKRDNLSKRYPEHINSLQSQLNRLSLQKENDPLGKKAELMRMAVENKPIVNIQPKAIQQPVVPAPSIPDECRCHHCVKIIQNAQCNLRQQMGMSNDCLITNNFPRMEPQCACMQKQQPICPCSLQTPIQPSPNTCDCPKMHGHINQPKNAVDKKSWMIEKYEQNQKHEGMEVEKQNTVIKEKREPTVSDLFKIIKLQNEQLQLLQEKVDKFITASAGRSVNTPQNYVTEHVALESVDTEQHKISIGVMTSFEMVRTSTVINKEIVTQTNENAQIQCNRSQISIKEVVSKTHPGTLNFLDGIIPQRHSPSEYTEESTQNRVYRDTKQQTENMNDDKTLNELSLYNVQVDNATTPLISPEQSLYLDVRDYSDSDTGSDDQSNVGWTYYNKVMTHVNGVLQDSDMPSSASALFRNTKQQCVQMQIDKTNVSVTKRVKFGDDPLGLHQPHIYAPASDTSFKMNQLAAKYLNRGAFSPAPLQLPVPKPSTMPIEMSFATRNYMERHRIIQGTATPRSPPPGEIPRFLDITALKQQPKLL